MSTTMTTTKNVNQNENQESMNQYESDEQTYNTTFAPQFDIWEGDDELVLYGDLPRVDPKHLDIQFENRQLTIHGKVDRCCNGQKKSLFSEYSVGDFHRTFAIGEAINSEGISAEMRDGVLTLHLPKSEVARPRRIEVKAN